MFGNLGNLAGLIRSAKDLQTNMARFQEEMTALRVNGEAGGGLVRATVDGKGMLVDIKIDPSALSDVELLEDLIRSASSEAVKKAQEAARESMSRVTGGLSLPPDMLEMLGGR